MLTVNVPHSSDWLFVFWFVEFLNIPVKNSFVDCLGRLFPKYAGYIGVYLRFLHLPRIVHVGGGISVYVFLAIL